MAAVFALIALTLFTWAVAVWATFEEEQEESTPPDTEQQKDQPSEKQRAA